MASSRSCDPADHRRRITRRRPRFDRAGALAHLAPVPCLRDQLRDDRDHLGEPPRRAPSGRPRRPAFLFLNLGLLLSVAFIPFPTRVLVEFVRTDDGQAAALLYGVTMLTMSATFLSVWLYASVGRRLLRPDADPQAVSGITRSFLPGLPMYAAATLVAFVSPEASAALFGLLALFYVLSSSWLGPPGAA
jgi:hypothetical protein